MACRKVAAKRAEDVVVLMVDRAFDSHGFLLLGSGETGCEEESGLEAFPDDWNASGDVYALRYGHPPSSKRFLLKIVRLGDQLLLHLLEIGSDKIETASVSTSEFVCSEDYSNVERCMKDAEKLGELIKRNLLGNIPSLSVREKQSSSSQKEKGQTRSLLEDSPLRIPPRHGHGMDPYRGRPVEPSPFGFGDADRMPFHSGGGGMVMDPFRTGGAGAMGGRMPGYHDPRLPRGAVPPGAQFDPFGPPGVGPGPQPRGPSGPDYDHMKPPGFDDMYM